MSDKIRVRFAPSPTGHLHIGSLRTAIFNWLFARHHGGTFLIRVEDTDQERSTKEYVDSIMSSLEWMGINSDEEIIFQRQQQDKQQKYLDQLFDAGRAYKCYCSQKKSEDSTYFKYDGTCYGVDQSQFGADQPYVVRFRLPEFSEEVLSFQDLVRDKVVFPADQLDDFIIARSDGSFMYNFAVVIDDVLMDITHVIRGDDHLNNTFKQLLLYEALKLNSPKFAHIPLILNESGSKLSKRDAAVSVVEYRKVGYLADALFNYLVRLGWSHGDDEVMSKTDIIKYFSLDHVGKSGAVFGVDKLQWLNGVYIREKDAATILELIERDVNPNFSNEISFDEKQTLELIALYQDRVKTLGEMCEVIMGLGAVPSEYDSEAVQKWVDASTKQNLVELVVVLEKLADWSLDSISALIKGFAKEKNLKLGQIAQPIRISLTGTTSSPSVFHLMETLKKPEILKRINQFLEFGPLVG